MQSRLIERGFETVGQIRRAGAAYLLDSFLQRGCGVCDRAAPQPLCLDCQRQLQDQIRNRPCPTPTSRLRIDSLGAYDGVLKRAILALKYENRPEMAQFLGAELGRKWHQNARLTTKPVYAVPIPLHSGRQRQRGYNQAALLAKSFCRTSGTRLLAHGLVRSQATVPQHQLGLEARQQNLEGAFELGKSLHRLKTKSTAFSIVLVDDIYTTGATIQSATEVLAEADISTTSVAVVAKT